MTNLDSELAAKGYKPRIVAHTADDGATWYRVRVGKFPSATAASQYARDLNGKEGETAIPVARDKGAH